MDVFPSDGSLCSRPCAGLGYAQDEMEPFSQDADSPEATNRLMYVSPGMVTIQ